MELEMSTMSAIAMPFASTFSIVDPVRGRARATIRRNTASPLRTPGSAASHRFSCRLAASAVAPRG